MNWDEYNKLFHKLELNLVAFQPLLQCDQEVLGLVNAALAEEREACAKLCDRGDPMVKAAMTQFECAQAIRARWIHD